MNSMTSILSFLSANLLYVLGSAVVLWLVGGKQISAIWGAIKGPMTQSILGNAALNAGQNIVNNVQGVLTPDNPPSTDDFRKWEELLGFVDKDGNDMGLTEFRSARITEELALRKKIAKEKAAAKTKASTT